MIKVIRDWYDRHFAKAEVIILFLSLFFIFGLITVWGKVLGPILASIIIAYLLQAVINWFEKARIPHIPAVLLVFLMFMATILVILFGMVPVLSRQLTNLFNELPQMFTQGQALLMHLPDKYPDIITPEQLQNLLTQAKGQISSLGSVLFSFSLSSIGTMIQLTIYLILVPLLVYYMLMDKQRILTWSSRFIPRDRGLLVKVWGEVNEQIGNYVRGKFIEMLIVFTASFILFITMKMRYAFLLSFLVGLSVFIPYVGAIVVSIPVFIIGFLQWGWNNDFITMSIVYLLIHGIDGNVLVPVLFSEVMDLHPIAIIMSILIFGAIWGFWGVFFAIPLATLVKAVLSVLPTPEMAES